jgi:15-cis-phytoene synthase
MRDLVARTRALFAEGMPLAASVAPDLRVDIEMFSRGGIAVLDAIERAGYNTLEKRPSIGKTTQAKLLGRALIGRMRTAGPARQIEEDRVAGRHSGDREDRHVAAGTATPEAVDASYDECKRVARESASNFYLAFYLLPEQKRRGLCALYAYMRLVDDAADEPGDVASKQRGLSRWRALTDAAYAGDTSGHAILPAFADTCSRYAIPARYFHDLISGAEMDLTEPSYATFDRLREYCYRVAGTVGLTCIHVFGFRDPRAPDVAERLGIAFQLTNILRDLRTDYEMGRVYLPQEDLDRFGVRANELAGPASPRIIELMEFEAERAWKFYEEGAEIVGLVEQDSRGALFALARTYSSLLVAIESRGFDVFGSRVRLKTAEKFGILVRAQLGAWSEGNVLEKRNRDRRRTSGTVRGRRAG